MTPTTQKKLVRENEIYMRNVTLDLLLNVLFVKVWMANHFRSQQGRMMRGQTSKDSKDLVLHPNPLPGIFYRWMALGSRGEGEGVTPDLE